MDQKLLLKEKDYELLHTKRVLQGKHSFHDPLINPPKAQKKKGKNSKKGVEAKPTQSLANNILDRRGPKGTKTPVETDAKYGLEEENESKIEMTPWKSILNLFIKSYDLRKESFELQVANVDHPICSLLEVRESKQN